VQNAKGTATVSDYGIFWIAKPCKSVQKQCKGRFNLHNVGKYGGDHIENEVLCGECGEPMQFYGWRGLNMMLICPGCGQVRMEKNPYWGLEEDLDRF